MDKNAIKKYAVWARRELISRVSQKALQYGITEKNMVLADADSVNGHLLTAAEKKQRQALIAQIKEKRYEQVMEEVAYTWFNRFSALRFMEVNGYLPTHVRVFTDEENKFKPQIIAEAIHLEMDGLNMEKVYAFKNANQTDELYKYLLITQCNALSAILPGMFQRIEDYTELLFPDNLLREGSVIEQMIALIPEEDWKDAVQIIGWLYQYYNSEPKDQVFTNLKKNIKISKENIPSATQLFTPDWIVRYMVENSLGRLWQEGHPNDELKAKWKYYLDEAEQEAEVKAKLDKIREEYKKIKPEEIRCIDPCMGSGHILVYMFDVLMQIYESYGYNQREAAKSIIENNLYGLDIDDRAAQLAYFAVMMKARQYDRRFFSRGVQPHVYAIRESNHLDKTCVEYFVNNDAKLKADMQTLIDELFDAKEYGSILNVSKVDFDALYARFDEIRDDIIILREATLNELLPFVQVAQAMVQKYDVVVTNPPYMGSSGMGAKLSEFVKMNYPDSKSDLSTAFMEKTLGMCKSTGFMAMINIPVWMFITSYEKLREKLLTGNTILNLLHFGRGVFGADFGSTSFVFNKSYINGYIGTYRKLYLQQGSVDSVAQKEEWFFSKMGLFYKQQEKYQNIPGNPIAYSLNDKLVEIFANAPKISKFALPKQGMSTCDVDRFIKRWFEVDITKTNIYIKTNIVWVKYNKGGEFRKWFGNREFLVYWNVEGNELRSNNAALRNRDVYFHRFLAWTKVTISATGFRWFEDDFLFDGAGGSLFVKNQDDSLYILGYLNSVVSAEILRVISPTVNYNENHIGSVPIMIDNEQKNEVDDLVTHNIALSRADWDSFETSWDFKRHPLFSGENKIAVAFEKWELEAAERFQILKANEEKINRIFINIYGLQDELTPEVENTDVTVRRADLGREIRSLISYAVGCMFGRYSLDMDGLTYAGGQWDTSKYHSFPADKDNIIPICDDEYFEDDIVGRFVKFIEVVYGKETLHENLKFIADALGGKGNPKDVIRSYFLNDFYADHCKTYQKRPIYWLFDSGKKNGFKALIYMHRYQQDTIARMRTDYVHEQQARYRTAIADLEQRINAASTGERVKLSKQLTKLQEQAAELRAYEEKIHHLADQMIRIDLNDGVKHNYEIFKDVLAQIK
jgi:type II restriction/modification system DNA methylase subunit YeeA